jgi:putative flavoprotein involved in K+ transport
MKYYDLPVDQHPLGTGVREKTNHYVTGRDGDAISTAFALEGMQLYGKFEARWRCRALWRRPEGLSR